jgi:hypothetical protein
MNGANTKNQKRRALFVTNWRNLNNSPGGVQTCTREYLSLLAAADFEIEIAKVEIDARLRTRIEQKIRPSPYRNCISVADRARVRTAAQDADLVFLNQVNLAGGLRGASFEDIRHKTVLLSHGAEVTDLVVHARSQATLPLSGHLRSTSKQALLNVLTDELAAREGIAAAICLSPFDADFERWLGVQNVTWIPRTVAPNPLLRNPLANTYGFIGTLDHAPNLGGLVDILKIHDAHNSGLTIRVVGGPERLGRWLESNFPSVVYLGALDDARLAQEASSWSAFLNPIFCQARGCSTKLATALGWELPIITTPVGRRGYVFSEGSMIEANSPDAFVEAMLSLVNPSRNKEAQIQVALAAKSCSSMADNARMIRPFFDMLMRA